MVPGPCCVLERCLMIEWMRERELELDQRAEKELHQRWHCIYHSALTSPEYPDNVTRRGGGEGEEKEGVEGEGGKRRKKEGEGEATTMAQCSHCLTNKSFMFCFVLFFSQYQILWGTCIIGSHGKNIVTMASNAYIVFVWSFHSLNLDSIVSTGATEKAFPWISRLQKYKRSAFWDSNRMSATQMVIWLAQYVCCPSYMSSSSTCTWQKLESCPFKTELWEKVWSVIGWKLSHLLQILPLRPKGRKPSRA